jgi:outer membrane receptor protein involved in Fe transport
MGLAWPLAILAVEQTAGAQPRGEPSSEPAPQPPPAPAAHASAPDDESLGADLAAALSQQVVSGASRATETTEEAPVAASIIRADDIRRYGIRTVGEALDFLSMGTFGIGGQNVANETVGARGVGINNDGLNHFSVIIDGTPVNNAINDGATSGYALGIPISMVDSIEVILGPGSIVYGGSAMLGVINIKTKPARQMHGLHLLAEYGVSPPQNGDGSIRAIDPSGFGWSPRLEGTLGETFSLFGKDAEATAGFLVASLNLPDVTLAPQSSYVGAPQGTPTYGGVLTSHPLESARGGYGRFHVAGLTLDVSYVEGTFAEMSTWDQVLSPTPSWDYSQLRADAVQTFDVGTHFTGFAALHALRHMFHAHEMQPAPTCDLGGTPGSRCLAQSDFGGNQQSAEVQGTWDFAADGRYQLMGGAEGRLRQVSAIGYDVDEATGQRFAPNAGFRSWGQTLGVYGQLRARLASWNAINVGVRGDIIHDSGENVVLPSVNPATYSASPDVTNSAVSPRAALMIFATSTTTAYASYSRAFRAPSPNELFFFGPTSNLAPETVDSGEIGLKQQFGAHRGIVSGFVSNWNNLIGLVPTNATGVTYGSSGGITNYGVNVALEGSASVDRLHYGLSFTYAYSRQELSTPSLSAFPSSVQGVVAAAAPESATKTELVGAPAASGNAHVSYDFRGDSPEVGLAIAVYGPRLTSFAYSNTLVFADPSGAPNAFPAFGYQWRSNTNPEYTDPMVVIRASVTGPVPKLPALRYHVFANYLATAALEPNAFGPNPAGQVPTVAAVPGLVPVPASTGQLAPATALTVGAGLELTLDP